MILSLDIDGVMLPFDGEGRSSFTESSVAFVRAMRDRGYRLILHSTWRRTEATRSMAIDLFAAAGIPLDDVVDADEPSKARAIAAWLFDEYAGDWPPVVIVDDDEIDAPWATVIRPSSHVGVTPDDLPAATAG